MEMDELSFGLDVSISPLWRSSVRSVDIGRSGKQRSKLEPRRGETNDDKFQFKKTFFESVAVSHRWCSVGVYCELATDVLPLRGSGNVIRNNLHSLICVDHDCGVAPSGA